MEKRQRVSGGLPMEFSNDLAKNLSAHLLSLDSYEGKKDQHKQLHLCCQTFPSSSKLSLKFHIFLMVCHSRYRNFFPAPGMSGVVACLSKPALVRIQSSQKQHDNCSEVVLCRTSKLG